MISITSHFTLPLHEALAAAEVGQVRRGIREGVYGKQTHGLAPGKLQANLIILPRDFAADFLRYCKKNTKPLPLIGLNRIGDPLIPQLGDIDLRTDLPSYNVYRFGMLTGRSSDILSYWRDDFAAFAIGSSYSFEYALAERGVRLCQAEACRTLPRFRTSIPTSPAGPFAGNFVVSMRAIRRRDIDSVYAVTARFPHAHGAPIHIGDPEVIGIHDLDRPDWGDARTIARDEVPVFWASGMSAFDALQRAKPEICITHSPGHMLLTDLDSRADIGSFKVF